MNNSKMKKLNKMLTKKNEYYICLPACHVAVNQHERTVNV